MKKFASAALLASAALALSSAHGHGTPMPNHGGQVLAVGETWLELVAANGSVDVYVEDDGDPLPSADLSGRLTVQNGAGKTDYVLKPAGGNKLEAKGALAPKGAKVTAVLVLADKKTKVPASFIIQ
jgi:hypothetical protein